MCTPSVPCPCAGPAGQQPPGGLGGTRTGRPPPAPACASRLRPDPSWALPPQPPSASWSPGNSEGCRRQCGWVHCSHLLKVTEPSPYFKETGPGSHARAQRVGFPGSRGPGGSWTCPRQPRAWAFLTSRAFPFPRVVGDSRRQECGQVLRPVTGGWHWTPRVSLSLCSWCRWTDGASRWQLSRPQFPACSQWPPPLNAGTAG